MVFLDALPIRYRRVMKLAMGDGQRQSRATSTTVLAPTCTDAAISPRRVRRQSLPSPGKNVHTAVVDEGRRFVSKYASYFIYNSYQYVAC